MDQTVPKKKPPKLGRITIAVDLEIQKELAELRTQGVDTTEWIRQMIAEGIARVRKQRMA